MPELRLLEVRCDPVRIPIYKRHNLLSSRRIGALADIQVRYLSINGGKHLRVTKLQFVRCRLAFAAAKFACALSKLSSASW